MLCSIVVGCFFLSNIDTIDSYFSSIATSYDKYTLRMFDATNIKFINLFFPNINIKDPSDVKKADSDISSIQFEETDSKDFGDELPWDKEVTHCEVLKHTDRDLYKNVQDVNMITFY